jgi:hypothetical protein
MRKEASYRLLPTSILIVVEAVVGNGDALQQFQVFLNDFERLHKVWKYVVCFADVGVNMSGHNDLMPQNGEAIRTLTLSEHCTSCQQSSQ